jgi:4a-hydroxytetrahydrobiopterin dehydratase
MIDRLSRSEISAAVHDLGWRYILGELRAAVATGSLARGAELASRAIAACGPDADGHLRVDVRADAVVFALQTPEQDNVTPLDIELAGRISEVAGSLGPATAPGSVQLVEIAVDALDIPAVRPFWKAVLGYVDVPGRHGDKDPLVDPLRQAPAVWFQQMDAPRPQRNRIHLDISVPHDAAPARLEAALAAGGVLVSDRRAPAFWVLADAEGNEVCITTWQGRD